MRHEDIWRAIDTLAAENGLSPSGLARRSGLDPTSFNPSKRVTGDGRPRWPSTESLSKVLVATGASLDIFAALVNGARALPDNRFRPRQRIPLIDFSKAAGEGVFDEGGFPTGLGWEEVDLPQTPDPHAYALRITGETLAPVYREGDTIIISPAAPVRAGDRVIVRARSGTTMAKLLSRRAAQRIELQGFHPAAPDLVLPTDEIAWIHRIIWASQ